MQLLHNKRDWCQYFQEMEEDLEPDCRISDVAPQTYPCLVLSGHMGRLTRHCFVYPPDALKLVKAVQGPGEQQVTEKTLSAASQDDFNKHITALVLSVIEELDSVSITKPERFEPLVARNLARVDQYQAGQVDQLCQGVRGLVLRELYPDVKGE